MAPALKSYSNVGVDTKSGVGFGITVRVFRSLHNYDVWTSGQFKHRFHSELDYLAYETWNLPLPPPPCFTIRCLKEWVFLLLLPVSLLRKGKQLPVVALQPLGRTLEYRARSYPHLCNRTRPARAFTPPRKYGAHRRARICILSGFFNESSLILSKPFSQRKRERESKKQILYYGEHPDGSPRRGGWRDGGNG